MERYYSRRRSILLHSAAVVILFLSNLSSVGAVDNAAPHMVILGTIDFPNAGASAAQPPFLTGVKALQSFEFDEAGAAFRAAQEVDPDFALAYWGEAMSFNHPLWAQQDINAAYKALTRYAPTAAERADKAPLGRERALMEAVDVLYGVGDKISRDIAYSELMQRIHQAYPEDDEIAILYALSLLGTVRPGDKGVRRQMQAAAIAMAVFDKNPNHPGAAHFIIHALDDPEHAILALPAARAYASIAPDAPHALHMPSHIFLQLGLWEDVVGSNTESYKASVDFATKGSLPLGRLDFHALSWLQYGQLQLGNISEARRCLDVALSTERDYPGDPAHNGAMMMLARYVLESENWAHLDLDLLTDRDNDHAALQFVAGLSATYTGNLHAARTALAKIADLRRREEVKPATAYLGMIISVAENQLASVISKEGGDIENAERLLVEAARIEATLNAPSGPPVPWKPSFEMYGEFLLAQGRFAEAEVQFRKALLRTPNRTKSVWGLEQARSRLSD